MINYEIICQLKKPVLNQELEDCLKQTVKCASKILNFLPKNNYFDLVLVGDQKIRTLNRTYRQKDRVTDVISLEFNLPFQFVNLENNHLGEIYLDFAQCVRQAKMFQHSLTREFCFLVLHGILHLIGYDHVQKADEEVMFSLQEQILNATNLAVLRRK